MKQQRLKATVVVGGQYLLAETSWHQRVAASAQQLSFLQEQPGEMHRQKIRFVDDLVELEQLGLVEIGPFHDLDHLGLIVRAPGDVDDWAAYLEDQGVTIVAKPRTHRDGARSCYVRDPDGNTIQIIHHPPISGS